MSVRKWGIWLTWWRGRRYSSVGTRGRGRPRYTVLGFGGFGSVVEMVLEDLCGQGWI